MTSLIPCQFLDMPNIVSKSEDVLRITVAYFLVSENFIWLHANLSWTFHYNLWYVVCTPLFSFIRIDCQTEKPYEYWWDTGAFSFAPACSWSYVVFFFCYFWPVNLRHNSFYTDLTVRSEVQSLADIVKYTI